MVKKKISNKIYYNVKNGGLERYYPETKTKEVFGEIGGLVLDLRVVDKVDYDKKPMKELQLEMWDNTDGGEYYVICTRLHRSFSDGLILSLANVPDLTEKLIVRGYTVANKDQNPAYQPSVFCSLKKYNNPEEKIKWIEGCPDSINTTYKGSPVKDREDRDAFLEDLIPKIAAKVRNNVSLVTDKLEAMPDEVYDEENIPGDED